MLGVWVATLLRNKVTSILRVISSGSTCSQNCQDFYFIVPDIWLVLPTPWKKENRPHNWSVKWEKFTSEGESSVSKVSLDNSLSSESICKTAILKTLYRHRFEYDKPSCLTWHRSARGTAKRMRIRICTPFMVCDISEMRVVLYMI